MINFLESVISFFANFFSIIFNFIDIKKFTLKLESKKSRVLCSIVVAFLLICAISLAYHYLFQQPSITVTQLMLNEYALTMSVGDTKSLDATVLYSDNSSDNNVLWLSSDQSVISISEDGQATALSEGNATIIAQASKNNTTESAECIITVKNPPSGYSISARPSGINSYYYIYIQPYDDDITQIKLYAKSPSGEIFNPQIDENDLYHFYSECGTWTIYASLENEGGIYEAHQQDDFLTIEITDISSNNIDILLQNITAP